MQCRLLHVRAGGNVLYLAVLRQCGIASRIVQHGYTGWVYERQAYINSPITHPEWEPVVFVQEIAQTEVYHNPFNSQALDWLREMFIWTE